ncbi:MAG: DUF2254 family protein [Rubricoccaceae bacterium]|nr:DUF2254 family protein [Rubricoccaceae bacterium]
MMGSSTVPIDYPSAWSRVRRGFVEFLWVPTVVVLGFAALAVGVVWLDRSAPGWIAPVRSVVEAHLFRRAGATNAFLGMVTTGLITMTSITFSMLLLALQQSASLIGAQVVYSFLLRRRNQLLLSFFLGSTLFALVVHASAHEGFNPLLGAALSLLLTAAALYALAVLVFTAVNQMRPQTVIGEVRTLTLEARRRQRELLLVSYRSPRYLGGTEVRIRTEQHGYVREVKVDPLREALATRRGEVEVEIPLEIGDYVAYGEELARVRAAVPEEAHRLAEVARKAVELDYQRAVRRDPSFGIEQIRMIGWSSGSTAYHNPSIAQEAIRNLRDIVARWTENYDEVEGSGGSLPLVYPDGLVQRALTAMESLAVVATESLQPKTFEEVLHAYSHVFGQLPEHLQDRTAISMGRLVTALGDLVLTPQLEKALGEVAQTLRASGYGNAADVVETATQQMASGAGTLAARATRVKEATSDASGP